MDRDEKLDILKGLASVLMLLAHNTIATTDPLERKIQFFGGMAPVFFFAVSGIILASYQLKRKPPGKLLVYYLFFFLLGFAYNDVWNVRDNSAFWNSNILQIIAISSIIIILLSLRFNLQKLAVFFPVPFLIHLSSRYIPSFPLKTFFFRPPGLFPVFPWLAFFLLGIFCLNQKKLTHKPLYKLILAGFMFVSFYFGPGYGIKWNMNIAYFTASSIIFAAFYHLLGKAKIFPLRQQIIFLGRNSFLFLFVHLFARDLLILFTSSNPVLWLGSLTMSYFIMKLLLLLNKLVPLPEKLWPGVWVGLIILIPAIPYLPHYAAYAAAYTAGFYISLNYSKLGLLVNIAANYRLPVGSSLQRKL